MDMRVQALLNRKNHVIKLSAVTAFILLAVLAGWRWMHISDTDLTTPVLAQTDIALQQRINQVEQRFYYIESRLNQLESQSRYSGTLSGSSTSNQNQFNQMRTEMDSMRLAVESLRTRLGEVECGLLKIDERTLAPAVRQARRQSVPNVLEPCRNDISSPVKLSSRP